MIKKFDEATDHITSACPVLIKGQDIKRHDSVRSTTLYHMRGNKVKLENEHWQEHLSKLVETSHEGKLRAYWNQQA
jgi:hypothetical protein